jgi:hypothetical protein
MRLRVRRARIGRLEVDKELESVVLGEAAIRVPGRKV